MYDQCYFSVSYIFHIQILISFTFEANGVFQPVKDVGLFSLQEVESDDHNLRSTQRNGFVFHKYIFGLTSIMHSVQK